MSKWEELKQIPMAPPLAVSPEAMKRAEGFAASVPPEIKEKLGKQAVLMLMGWLQQRWEDTRCPCAAWQAWQLCRDAGKPPPAFLMEAMDEIAERGLGKAGIGGNAKRLRTHNVWLDAQWRGVLVEMRKYKHGENNTDARNAVAGITASSYSRVTDAHNALKSTTSTNSRKRG